MSIRLKVLLGCFSLTLVTLLLGGFAQESQRRVGAMSIQLYDDALISTNALRSAQNALTRLDARFRREPTDRDGRGPLTPAQQDHLISEMAAITADLAVASEGSISVAGREATEAMERRGARLSFANGTLTGRFLLQELGVFSEEIDAVVRIFAADAYGVRNDVGALVNRTIERTWAAMAIAAVIALLISFAISRTIVPALRNAVSIAKAISEGRFDSRIEPVGRSETAELLTALAVMQERISQHFGRIQDTVATQADAYDGQISIQNSRFEAALNNMTQGLCMFDAKGRLVIVNKRFGEMFGVVETGKPLAELAKLPVLGPILTPRREPFFTLEREDGTMVAVSRQAVAAGGQVMTFEDVTERHKAAVRLEYMAKHDALTGLPNRVQLGEHLQQVLGDARKAAGTAMLCLDLDGFKFVNDTLGHPVGDALLKAVGIRLREVVGEGNLVARIGGDEFAIAQTAATQPLAAETLAAAIITALSLPFDIDHQRVTIGVSIGIMLQKPGALVTDPAAIANTTMKSADLALYAAKAKGRNTYAFFEPEMEEKIQRRRRTEIDLGLAMERQEFELYYQPFVNAATQTLSGFEALLRWSHPLRGMVSPAEFIPIAEEVGLIDQIGLWVLDTACRQAAAWPEALSVSVNLSPVQFRSATLFTDVRRILKASGLPPQRLQLEITESVLLQETETVLAILNAFRRLGIRVSMDDFGTGYSSLGYLSRFPFDKVKIDQSFIKDLSKRQNLAVVRAVIGLSKAMGIAVIAEGVETRDQRATLLSEGCEEMQGYYFSRPRPASDLPQMMMQIALSGTEPAAIPAAAGRTTPERIA